MSPLKRPSIDVLTSLSPQDIQSLAKILSIPPSSSQQALPTPSPSLLAPTGIIPSLKKHIHLSPQAKQTNLCPTHSKLSRKVIRRLFIQVEAEVTEHVKRFEQEVSHPHHLSVSVRDFLERVKRVKNLWVGPMAWPYERYCDNGGISELRPSPELHSLSPGSSTAHSPSSSASTSTPHRSFSFVLNGCEACILSHIGSSPQTLLDLRANMIGRKKKRREQCRLMRVVEAWINHLGSVEKERLRWESEILGKELRNVRKAMQLARGQLRRNEAEGILNSVWRVENGGGEVRENDPCYDDHYEAEHEIIDAYLYSYSSSEEMDGNPRGGFCSESNYSSQDGHLNRLQPTSVEGILYDHVTGTFSRRHPVDDEEGEYAEINAGDWDSESVYSDEERCLLGKYEFRED